MMKLYSDTLTASDLHAAVPNGCYLETVAIGKPRNRKHGWIVRLTGNGRPTNSGTYGAGSERSATWDQHGEWMSALYERDSTMIVGPYRDRDDFHRSTNGIYRPGVVYAGKD